MTEPSREAMELSEGVEEIARHLFERFGRGVLHGAPSWSKLKPGKQKVWVTEAQTLTLAIQAQAKIQALAKVREQLERLPVMELGQCGCGKNLETASDLTEFEDGTIGCPDCEKPYEAVQVIARISALSTIYGGEG